MDASQFREMLDKMLPSDKHYTSQEETNVLGQITSARSDLDDNEEEDSLVANAISEVAVLAWLRENEPEFLVNALKSPEDISDSKEFRAAMVALGYITPWEQVNPGDLDKREYANWLAWDESRRAAEQELHDDMMNDY